MQEVNRSFVNLEDIVIGEDFNPRTTLGDIESLAKDIDEKGLIQPLVVREGGPAKDGARKMFLVAGERRFRALQKLGHKRVEVKFFKGSMQECSELAWRENFQRKTTEPLEDATFFQRYMKQYGITQAQAAKRLSVSPALMSQRLSLLKPGSADLKKAVEEKRINATQAREIATLPPAAQKEVLDKVDKKREEGKKVRTVEVKAEAERRKASYKRSKVPDYDKEKVQEAKDAYEGVKMTPRSKNELLEQIALLFDRAERAKSVESKRVAKGQVAALEWALSIREELG